MAAESLELKNRVVKNGNNNNGTSNGEGQHHVRLNSTAIVNQREHDVEAKGKPSPSNHTTSSKLKTQLLEAITLPDWVTSNAKRWKSWKIVIRCSIAAWVGLLLMIIGPTERAIGNAAFLMNIVSIIMPPSDPIAPTIEKYIIATFFVAFAWAFSCIGIRCSWLARSEYRFNSSQDVAALLASQGVPAAQLATQTQESIFRGDYVEAGSSVVLAFWYFMFCGLMLYFRAWIGPSPYAPGVILSIIMATIVLLYSPLFPYPFYALGKQFFIPFIIQIAINLICAVLIFPDSVHDQFIERLVGVIQPLQSILEDQQKLLETDPESDEWLTFGKLKTTHGQATKALGLLGVTEGLLSRNVSIQRASGEDLQELLNSTRALSARVSGFTHFQDFVDKHLRAREDDDDDANLVLYFAPSRPGTPRGSRPGTPSASRPTSVSEQGNGSQEHIKHSHSHGILHDLLNNHHIAQKERQPVGFSESHAYMMLEQSLGRGQDLGYLPDLMSSLRQSCQSTITEVDEAMTHIANGFGRLKSGPLFWYQFSKSRKHDVNTEETSQAVVRLKAAIEHFENSDRLRLVRDFVHLFDPDAKEEDQTGPYRKQSHRGLFLAYTYQFSLLAFAQATLAMLEQLDRIEKKRIKLRLYVPPLKKLMAYLSSDGGQEGVDEDPENIEGLGNEPNRGRDPDVMRPTKMRHRLGALIWQVGHRLTKPDVLFGIKAGVFSCLAAFPAFFSSTAGFYYRNRGLWVTIMVALTMSRFVGDTAFQFVLRVMGTFIGAVVGLTIWYVGNANSQGNPYGMGAVCAVAFPLMIFYRLHHPIIVQGILTMVTAVLVLGYSWQDATFPSASTAGWGWEVAWKRFLLVLIGISIAFVTAYIPPRSTQKKTIRLLYARTLDANATIFFRLISLALQKKGPRKLPPRFMRDVTSVRVKLLKSAVARDMIKYEVSLRGQWPAKQYERLAALQTDLIDLIAQFGTVILTMPDAWTMALLKRTRLQDPDFLAHISSTTTLASNALRVGRPLPFYHAPLLQSFLRKPHGYEVSMSEHADPELPSHVDLETLSSLEYLQFSTAVSLAYSIVNRLDRIQMVVKQLVGEDLHVNGVGISGKNESEEELLADVSQSRRRLSTSGR